MKSISWIKVKVAAEILEVTPQRVHQLINSGRFRKKETLFRKYILVCLEDVEQYLEDREAV